MLLKPNILPLAASLGQAGPGPREQGKNGMCSGGGRRGAFLGFLYLSISSGLGMRKGEEKASHGVSDLQTATSHLIFHLTFSLGLSHRFYSFPYVSPTELFLLLLPEKQPKRAFVLGCTPRINKCFSACFSFWLHSWAYFRLHSNCFSTCLPTHPSVHLLCSRQHQILHFS